MSTELVGGEGFRIDGQIVTHVASGAWFQISKADSERVHKRNTKNLEQPAEIEALALEAWKLHLLGPKEEP
ncbi:MAG TPA: hypothetical protein VG271_18650 [Beijerinckiaceae bacterium]|nr:hypothetical protein [Beijerinckiaceae bacterium]